jgi:hypothetical protein
MNWGQFAGGLVVFVILNIVFWIGVYLGTGK